MEDKLSFDNISTHQEYLNYSTGNGRISKPFQHDTQKDEIIKLQEEKIKTLKRTIKGYQKNIELQNAKISNQDTLYVELNSLNKNYAEMENELNQYKAESMRLNEIIQNKNCIIAEFQKLIELSTTKFEIFEETNMSLKLRIEEYEAKLQILPQLANENNDLKGKISGYESKIETLLNETSKREDIFKSKMNNFERSKNGTIRQYEEDIQELKIAIERLKIENEKYKKMSQEANLTLIDKETVFKKKMDDKEREHDLLSKKVSKFQQELKDIELNYKDKMSLSKDSTSKQDKEIKSLSSELRNRNEEIQKLNNIIFEYDTTISETEQELKSRTNIINSLTEERDRLMNQLNDKQIDFVEYQNSSQQEIEILHRKLILIDKERAGLLKEKETNRAEIGNLKEQISLYETHSNNHLNECKEVDDKYNDLVKAFELKEEEHENEYENYSSKLTKMQSEFSVAKAKYEKKIQMLKLSNDELEARVKNLINSLISLKDYAISIERNINDNANFNNSAFINSNANMNLTSINYKDGKSQKNSRQLIDGLKDMINRIDSKILSANGKMYSSTINSRICYEN